MKFLLTSTLVLLSVLCHSCNTPDPNREVILPEGPKMEEYFLTKERIHSSLSSNSPVAFTELTFQFKGSYVAKKRHNVDQAKALAKAIKLAPLNTQQFMLVIKGNEASSNHSRSLLHLLGQSGVPLYRVQITTQNEQSGGDLIETSKEVTLNKVEIREL